MTGFEPGGDVPVDQVVSSEVLARSARLAAADAAAAWEAIAAGGGAVPLDGATAEWFTHLVDSSVAELVAAGADPGVRELMATVASAGYAWGRVVVDTAQVRVSWSGELAEWVVIDDRVAAADVADWDLHVPALADVSRRCVDWVESQVAVWRFGRPVTEVVSGGALIAFDEAVVGAFVEADLAATR